LRLITTTFPLLYTAREEELKGKAFFLLAAMRLRSTAVSTPPTPPPEGAVGAMRSVLCSRGKKVAEKVVVINPFYFLNGLKN